MEWGLHEDEFVWNGDCMRTIPIVSCSLQNVYVEKGHVIVDRQMNENSLSNYMEALVCMTCVHNNIFSTIPKSEHYC